MLSSYFTFRIFNTVTVLLFSLLLSGCGSSSSDSGTPVIPQTTPDNLLGYWQGKATYDLTNTEDINAMIFKNESKYYMAIISEASKGRSSLNIVDIVDAEIKSSSCSSNSSSVQSCSIKTVSASESALIGTYTYQLEGKSSAEFPVSFSLSKQNNEENKMSLPERLHIFQDVEANTRFNFTGDKSFSTRINGERLESTDLKIDNNIIQVTEAKSVSFTVNYWMVSLSHFRENSSKLFSISLFSTSDLSKHGTDAGWSFNISTDSVASAYDEGKKWYENGLQSNVGAKNCSICHGVNGEGGIGLALKGNSNVQSDGVIDTILNGVPLKMAAFSTQTNQVIAELVTYLRYAWGNSPTNEGYFVEPEQVQAKR